MTGPTGQRHPQKTSASHRASQDGAAEVKMMEKGVDMSK